MFFVCLVLCKLSYEEREEKLKVIEEGGKETEMKTEREGERGES